MADTSMVICEGLLESITKLDEKLALLTPKQKIPEPHLIKIHNLLEELDRLKKYTIQLIDRFKSRDCAELRILHKVIFIEDIARTRIYTIKYFNQKKDE